MSADFVSTDYMDGLVDPAAPRSLLQPEIGRAHV